MRTNLKEKVAFVTGASSGLGTRFARVLAANGALTVLAARRVERLKDLRAEIESEGGAAHVVELDVTQRASVQASVDSIQRMIALAPSGTNGPPGARNGVPDAARLRARSRNSPRQQIRYSTSVPAVLMMTS